MKNRFAIGVVLLGVAMAGQAPAVGQSKGPVTLALTGDSIITQRISPFKEPEFTGVMDLVRGADAADGLMPEHLIRNSRVLPERLREARLDEPRADHVGADAVGAPFLRHHLGE